MKTTLMLAGLFVLAACSRNPEPNTNETGRADTTTADTAWVPRVDTTKWDTLRPTPRRTDTMPSPRWPDTTGRDTMRTPKDTLRTPKDTMRTPRDTIRTPGDTVRTPTDTMRTPSDTARVPYDP